MPLTHPEAVTLAFKMALAASDEFKSLKATIIAEGLANEYGFSKLEIERCKRAALKEWYGEA